MISKDQNLVWPPIQVGRYPKSYPFFSGVYIRIYRIVLSLGFSYMHKEAIVNYKVLASKDLFAMKVGDRFRVYWAKDDDPSDVRLDYDILTVIENDGKEVLCNDCWEFYMDEAISEDSNELDTSRGIAYLYYE